MLMGTGWDEYPFNSETLDFIRWYDSQEWEYPRLVDCTWNDFWKYIEAAIGRGAKVPTLKGDFGSSWEEWPAQLAYINSLYRKARGVVQSAQAASAAAAVLTGRPVPAREEALYDCFLNLVKFADHNIGGILPAGNAMILETGRLPMFTMPLKKGSQCLEGSLAEIAENIRNDGTVGAGVSTRCPGPGAVR